MINHDLADAMTLDVLGIPTALIITSSVILAAFATTGVCSAFGGVLLARYVDQDSQSMGDSYLLCTIAAVLIGGTLILSVLQFSNVWRSITLMLLFQTLRRKEG
ncbi:hypothetical protein [Tateyamaria pelophila]|uniref:hypothetical protein n=1 Tax=Tateyamaria pelophila TaxID=328415 RepID=UPI001CBF8C8D|nr:hypothetical protein [Tateyamaria pelophila]